MSTYHTRKMEAHILISYTELLHNQSLYTVIFDSQACRPTESKHTTAYRNVNCGKTEFMCKYGTPIVSRKLNSQNPVVDRVPYPTPALKNKGNKVMGGDSSHWGILTVSTYSVLGGGEL